MAKAKKKKPAQRKKRKKLKLQIDPRLRVVMGLICLFIALFALISLVSYFFTWQADQSFLDLDQSSSLIDQDIEVENWAGKAGALISNLLIYKWFGVSSLIFVLLIGLVGFYMLGAKPLPLGRTTKYSLILVVWLSITLAYTFGKSAFLLGGGHGKYISEWLSALLGVIGTGVLIIISGLVILVFLFKVTFEKLQLARKKKERIKDVGESPDDAIEDDGTFTVSELEPVDEDAGMEDQQLSVSVDENDQIEVDFNPDVPFPNGEELVESDNEAVTPEMTVENTTEIKEDTGGKKNPEILDDYDPTLDLENFTFPGLELLHDHSKGNTKVTEEELIGNKNRIVETLGNYKITIEKIKATVGPTITLYEIIPAKGIRISKIKNLEDDIALSLSALGIRIIAPIPGRGTIGIEVPNRKPEIVSMFSILNSKKFKESTAELPIALGKTISNETYILDLAKMPHLLVAGATGQGKSVGLNAIIASLLYKKHPSQIKFVMVDPKKVELTLYSRMVKHYLAQMPEYEDSIITDTNQVIYMLNSLSCEMDERYNLLKKAEVRNIKEYNGKFTKRRLNPEKGHRYLPYIIMIIDEFADLIMTAGKEIEIPLTRIAQLARAVGIHMVIATQRPSTNIITGTIKANFPARIAFRVSSMIDSRTILDSPGANHLVGRGDMLVSQGADLERLQCAFIDTPEVEAITQHISTQQGYPGPWLLPEPNTDDGDEQGAVNLDKLDDLFEEAARLVVSSQQGSTSSIQRKFSIGYNRAGRIMDQLEASGIVGPADGSKPRQVHFMDAYTLEKFLNQKAGGEA